MATADQIQKKRDIVSNQLNTPPNGNMFQKNLTNTNSVTTSVDNTPKEPFMARSTPVSGMAKASADATSPNTLMQQNPAIMQGNPAIPTNRTTSASAQSAPSGTPATAPQPTVPEIKVDFSKGGVFDQYKPMIDAQYQSDVDFLDKQYQQGMADLELQRQQQLRQGNANREEIERNYRDAQDQLAQSLYQAQERANVDIQRRGISNSPQAIGLMSANNQTYQKNLVQMVEKRNVMLNDLNNKILEIEEGYGSRRASANLDYLGRRNELMTSRNQSMWDGLLTEHRDKEAKK